jgi:hypothetical protein
MLNPYLSYSEATIQAELYHQFRAIGVKCYLEVVTAYGVIDILVLNEKCRGVAIIECKRAGIAESVYRKQIERYKNIGLPVYSFNRFEEAKELADKIDTIHSNDYGLDLLQVMADAKLYYGTMASKKRVYKWMRDADELSELIRLKY